jgi:hypothetical protein
VSIIPWSNPIPGQADQIQVDAIPLQLVPGKYSVEEADRFGEKVSQGSLKYADFNPFESAHSSSALIGGAGLRRYSDAGEDPTQFATLYTESSNVNCAFTPAVLSPQITYEALPGANGPAQWLGEELFLQDTTYIRRILAVAPTPGGTGVYLRADDGTWSVFASITRGPPLGPAIGLFDGQLIIGFGAAGVAVVIDRSAAQTDVTNTALQGMYVWAYTNDHAANYVAGGPAVTDFSQIWSSLFVDHDYELGAVASDTPPDSTTGIVPHTGGDTGDTPIISLAPGGGLVLVYVGKIDELGMVDTSNAIYHSLVPFDSRLTTNCNPLKWLLASGTDQARGSMTLVFTRERSLWEYAPSSQFSGTASNIAPWSHAYRRPPNARGLVRAIQGTARFLYYAVENGSGETWIWRNDQTTGAPHTYLALGNVPCRAMTVAFPGDPNFPSNPLLMFSAGTNVGTVVLPLDGDAEYDDPNCRYQFQGYVDLPDVDLGFPDEDKIGFEVRIASENLSPGHRYFMVQMSEDGGSWTDLHTRLDTQVDCSPGQSVYFPLASHARRIKLRIRFFTDDATQSPKLWGFSLRVALNTKVYRLFVFQVRTPAGSLSTLADDLQNPYLLLEHFWNARRDGNQLNYTDPWNDAFVVRLIKLQQQQALREPDKTPEWVLDFTLLEYDSAFLRVPDRCLPALVTRTNGQVPSGAVPC